MDTGEKPMTEDHAMQQGLDEPPVRLAFFGHNRKDAAIVRRALSFLDAGLDVTGFMFRRDGEPAHPGPAWKNVDLGMVEHCKHTQRILTLLRALTSIFHNRRMLRSTDIVYARNLDMLILAALGLLFASTRQPRLVYECLDVHEALTRKGIPARMLRWAERFMLRHSDLLVVSSPGFIREYFVPVQRYKGPHLLIENKLYFQDVQVERPEPESVKAKNDHEPLVIGWIGILRCQKTLDLIKATAKAEGDKVHFRFHGLISEFLIPDFLEQIAPYANIDYHGPYEWPTGLREAYKGIDLVWAQELSWRGHNSDWLLPNRIYEGSYFGALSLAIAGTETGHVVEERKLGYALPNGSHDSLIQFLRHLDKKELATRKRALLSRPRSDFVTEGDEIHTLIGQIMDIDNRYGTHTNHYRQKKPAR
ncbi:MAG TPA: glycosyl transferase [Chromatiales bacterium]|nr:glycosyl transferase [Chromatiales bacterium]